MYDNLTCRMKNKSIKSMHIMGRRKECVSRHTYVSYIMITRVDTKQCTHNFTLFQLVFLHTIL